MSTAENVKSSTSHSWVLENNGIHFSLILTQTNVCLWQTDCTVVQKIYEPLSSAFLLLFGVRQTLKYHRMHEAA